MAKIKVINVGNVAYNFKVLNTEYVKLSDGKTEVRHRELKDIIINGKYNKLVDDNRLIVYQNEAITMIDEDEWKYILEKYSHSEPIKQKIIYADTKNSESNLLAYAKEMKDESKPCDPLDINKISKRTNNKVEKLELDKFTGK